MKTPFVIRYSKTNVFTAPAFISSLIRHVEGVLRWQDMDLDSTETAYRDMIKNVRLSYNEQHVAHWRRHSSAQPGRTIPMTGIQGKLTLSGADEMLIHFIRVAGLCQVGERTSF